VGATGGREAFGLTAEFFVRGLLALLTTPDVKLLPFFLIDFGAFSLVHVVPELDESTANSFIRQFINSH